MSEQSGTGRYPKPPQSEAWAGSDFNSNDPDIGNFGSPFAEVAGKDSSTKAGSENGQGVSVPHPVAGSNFAGGPSGVGSFEQGEMPSADIDYFSFNKG